MLTIVYCVLNILFPFKISGKKNENSFTEQRGAMNFCPILNDDATFKDVGKDWSQNMQEGVKRNPDKKQREKEKEKEKEKDKETQEENKEDNSDHVNHNGRCTFKPRLDSAAILENILKENINNEINLFQVSQSVGIERQTKLLPRGAKLGATTSAAVKQTQNKLTATDAASRLGVRGSPLGGRNGGRSSVGLHHRSKLVSRTSDTGNSNNCNNSHGIFNAYGFEDNCDGSRSKDPTCK